MENKLYTTCANCQLICVADKEERKRRYKLLRKGGVVIQDPDGSVRAVTPEEANEHMDNMPEEKKWLYEGSPAPPAELLKQFEELTKN